MSASPRPSAGVRRRLKILLAAICGLFVLLGVGAQVASAEPAFDVEPPEVEVAPGNRLVCDPGSWEGSPPPSFDLHLAAGRLRLRRPGPASTA